MAFSFSLILTAFSIISSWVAWLPPRRAKFGPVVTRLWPSESSPTPSRSTLALFFLETFGINRGYRQKQKFQGAIALCSPPGASWNHHRSAGGRRPQHVARSRWSGEFQRLYTG